MKTVLLVHDHQENPWERKQQIEASGYAVELVSRADDCMSRLEYGLPDLVLIDVLLEGENGFELCRRIRERHDEKQLPILLSSRVFADDRYRREARAVGAQEYFLRPLPLSELIRIINRWIRFRPTVKTSSKPPVAKPEADELATTS